jgi:hypothetical protein
MSYDVRIVEVAATPLASVRRQVAWSEVGAFIPRLLDDVYKWLRGDRGASKGGHNAAEGGGDVRCSATPAGRAVYVVYTGEYAGLGEAHDALHAYCREHALEADGPSWEVYGDWAERPEDRRTDVYRLLTSAHAP